MSTKNTTTPGIVAALLLLGVESPAVAHDVLAAAGLDLPPGQVPVILNAVALARAENEWQRQANVRAGDPGE